MNDLQLLSFEVTPRCNLSDKHPWCPSTRAERYHDADTSRPMDDIHITKFVAACQQNGFKGRVAFHYYNEPTLDLARCFRLAKTLLKMNVESILWTNGTCRNIEGGIFADVFATNYNGHLDGETRSIPYTPDQRIMVYSAEPCKVAMPCYRPLEIEMPVNYYGNIRMCCGDWKGTVQIGNIITDNYQDIFNSWSRVITEAIGNIPDVCKRCASLERSPILPARGYKVWA